MKPMNPSGISNFTQVLNNWFKVLVGNVGFGSATAYDSNQNGTVFSKDNADGLLVRVGSSANPFGLVNKWSIVNNTATVITHNLGRVPVGYFVANKSVACDVYGGSPFVATSSTITLSCTVNTADVLLFIF